MQSTTEQQLCTTCGLCCSSFFSVGYISSKDEKYTVEKFGGELFNNEKGQLCFRQPCPAYHGNCSIYPNHPASCQGFECTLLKKLRHDEITLEHAISLVQQTKDVVSQIDETLASLLGKRKVSTIYYMQQFYKLLEIKRENIRFKHRYKKALGSYAVFMFMRKKYFPPPDCCL